MDEHAFTRLCEIVALGRQRIAASWPGELRPDARAVRRWMHAEHPEIWPVDKETVHGQEPWVQYGRQKAQISFYKEHRSSDAVAAGPTDLVRWLQENGAAEVQLAEPVDLPWMDGTIDPARMGAGWLAVVFEDPVELMDRGRLRATIRRHLDTTRADSGWFMQGARQSPLAIDPEVDLEQSINALFDPGSVTIHYSQVLLEGSEGLRRTVLREAPSSKPVPWMFASNDPEFPESAKELLDCLSADVLYGFIDWHPRLERVLGEFPAAMPPGKQYRLVNISRCGTLAPVAAIDGFWYQRLNLDVARRMPKRTRRSVQDRDGSTVGLEIGTPAQWVGTWQETLPVREYARRILGDAIVRDRHDADRRLRKFRSQGRWWTFERST